MLRVRDLGVERQGVRTPIALASLDVAAGETVALVAPNGSGKTAVLRAIAGLDAHTGSVALGDRDLSGAPAEERLRAGFALVPAGRRLFSRLTVEQNLVAGSAGLSRAQARSAIAETFARFPLLRERAAQRAGTLSGGEGQVLLIARALVTSPAALLVDEPLEGLSSEASARVLGVLASVAAGGAAVLLASPDPVPGAATVALHSEVPA